MVWQAGAIAGEVGLDNSPLVRSIRSSIGEVRGLKSAVEGQLGNLKADVNVKAMNDSLGKSRKDFSDFSNIVHRTQEDMNKIKLPENPGIFDKIAANAKKVQMEDRLSGEIALGRFAGRGLGGMADMGVSMLGLGAAGIVISGIAQGLNEILSKSHEWSEELAKGNINAADIGMSIGKSIPVLDKVFELGETINDMFTGNKSAIEENAKSIELMNTAMETQRALAAEWKKIIDGASDRLRNVASSNAALKALLGGRDQEAADITAANETQNELNAENRQYDADRQSARDAFTKRQDAARAAAVVSGRGISEDERKKRQEKANNEILAAQSEFNQKMKDLEQKHQATIAGIQESANLKAALRGNATPAKQFLAELRDKTEFAGKTPEETKFETLRKEGKLTGSELREAEELLQRHKATTKALEYEKTAAEEAKKAQEDLATMQAKAASVGMTEGQKAYWDYAARPGVTEDQKRQFKAAADLLDAAAKQKEYSDSVKKAIEDSRSLAKQFTDAREKYAEMLANGDINEAQYDRLVKKSRKDIFGDGDLQDLSRVQTGGQFASAAFAQVTQVKDDGSQKVADAVGKVETAVGRVEKAITGGSVWGSD